MRVLLALMLGATAGFGLFAAVLGAQRQPVRPKQRRLSSFKTRTWRLSQARAQRDVVVMAVLGVAGAVGGWLATGWPVAALICAGAAGSLPVMIQAPKRRREIAAEIDAYAQWTEQVRDLVRSTGSLYEAAVLSAPQSPPLLRPKVTQMAALARVSGLPSALDWFADEMRSPFADRLVLGMRISWESGARVTESFDATARAMREQADMRRRNEVGNARIWTQVMSILAVTFISVSLMFVVNKGFFDPFGTTTGQMVLLGVGALIFGNIYWVLKLATTSLPARLLAGSAAELPPADAAQPQ